MTKNMGTIDRIVRIVIAVALFGWAFFAVSGAAPGLFFWLAVVAGSMMLLTAGLGNCPAYRLIGVKTCRTC